MKIKQYVRSLIFVPIGILLICAGCITKHNFILKKNIAEHTIKPTITVWVHGTKVLPEKLFKTRLFARPGLHPVLSYDKTYALRRRTETLCSADPVKFQLHHFYLFGWSGKLSFQDRIDAAQQLYDELYILIEQYTDWLKQKPYVRFITHSHGGNVAMDMARHFDEHKPLYIDELVLLACPVQEHNKHLITHDMFGKIYHIFSTFDIVQIMDPQGFYKLETEEKRIRRPLFSQRTFEPTANMIQTKIKINGRGIGHLDFIFEKFMVLLPHVLHEMDLWYQGQEPSSPKQPWLFHIRKT